MSSVISMPIDLLRAPSEEDNKYTRGVVGLITGSIEYPGAAILSVSAAIRTGVGMARFLGNPLVADQVLRSRPEMVTQPGSVHAWVVGSGVSSSAEFELQAIAKLFSEPGVEPLVIDAGAFSLVSTGTFVNRQAILTPHLGEARALAKRLSGGDEYQSADQAALARFLSESTGATILLKGHQSLLANGSSLKTLNSAPTELATAGTGDVLAGILGALLAINHRQVTSGEVSLEAVAEVGVALHSEAAKLASAGAPIAAMDVVDSIGQAVLNLRVQ